MQLSTPDDCINHTLTGAVYRVRGYRSGYMLHSRPAPGTTIKYRSHRVPPLAYYRRLSACFPRC